jgi:hypothetical protein
MKSKLATAVLALAFSMPAYAGNKDDYDSHHSHCSPCYAAGRAIAGVGRAVADANAKILENRFVRAHERTERRIDREERTRLNAQYRIMDSEYHKHCVPHCHQAPCSHSNASVSKPVPYQTETIIQQPTLAPSQKEPILAPTPEPAKPVQPKPIPIESPKSDIKKTIADW